MDISIQNKTCTKCGEQKLVDLFNKKGSICKECNNLYRKNRFKKYYEVNKEKLLNYDKQYREQNKEKIKNLENKYRKTERYKSFRKQYYKTLKEEHKEKLIKWNSKKNDSDYKEKKKIYDKKRYEQNREKYLSFGKKYYSNNKDKCILMQKEYRKKHKNKLSKRASEIRKYKLKNDPFFTAVRKLRSLVETAFKRVKQNKPMCTEALLGCSFEFAKKHIESLFTTGMTWQNHGRNGWHIDHIKPISSFDINDLHLANHYTNLQPLWAKDNLSKGCKY